MDTDLQDKQYLDEVDIFKSFTESKYNFTRYKFNFKKKMLDNLNGKNIDDKKNKLNKKSYINTYKKDKNSNDK
jgi:hypothetical protein